MKKYYTILLVLTFLLGMSSVASSANLDGHLPYRIVSYSFSSDDTSLSSDSIAATPLLITGTTSDILLDSATFSPGYGSADPRRATDIFSVSADFEATPDLSLRGAFGVTKNRWDAGLNSDYNSSWEANVGVIYRLFNNIRYEVHFGYMETGDVFKESNTYSDVESIIMISNKLSMSF